MSDAGKQEVLQAVLPLVPFSGWSEQTLLEATRAAGLTPLDCHRLFPGGMPDVITYFGEVADREMLDAFATKVPEIQKIRDKVAVCIECRLDYHTSHKEAVRRLLAWYALPPNVLAGSRRLWQTADVIWRACGDTATDFNHYTKRVLLSAVYSSTLPFWLEDDSENWDETRAFIRRRIDDVMQIPKAKATCEKLLRDLPGMAFFTGQSGSRL